MVLGDWQEIVATLSPDTPVIFYRADAETMPEDSYCDGLRVAPSSMWSSREGWQPCVTVDLGRLL